MSVGVIRLRLGATRLLERFIGLVPSLREGCQLNNLARFERSGCRRGLRAQKGGVAASGGSTVVL